MKYRYIIFDVDDTLLDFGRAFRDAQRDMSVLLGVDYSDEYCAAAERCGYKAWRESGMENTESPDVQENYHRYYYGYLRKQCFYLRQEFSSQVSEEQLLECYLAGITGSSILMEPGTLEVYRMLSEKFKLVLATNGMKKMQTRRVEAFIPYTYRLYISEEISAIKPSAGFYSYVLNDLGCEPGECLMVGDSLTNDILGAMSAGIDTCWYNIKHRPVPEGVRIDREIFSIEELADILL